MVSLEKLTIATPNYMTLLVEALDLKVAAGGSLLVMGPSGCGKSSLLRAIGGLWDSGEGSITRPGPDEVMVRACLGLQHPAELCMIALNRTTVLAQFVNVFLR